MLLTRIYYSFFQAIENCIGTAGFSVGEYAALVFAGALNFEDGKITAHFSTTRHLSPRIIWHLFGVKHPDLMMLWSCNPWECSIDQHVTV